jgi:hypothetical protein
MDEGDALMGKSVGVRDGGELHSLFLGMLCAHMENGGEEEEEEEEAGRGW